MASYFQWKPGIEKKLQREFEQKFRNLKVEIPVEGSPRPASGEVDDMSERERAALVWLDNNLGARAFHEIAAALRTDVSDVADTCRRLQQRDYLEVTMVSGGEQNYFVILHDDGRVAAADVRRLPEREKQRAEAERKERRGKRRQTFHDKYFAPIIVGIVVGVAMLIVGFLWGRM